MQLRPRRDLLSFTDIGVISVDGRRELKEAGGKRCASIRLNLIRRGWISRNITEKSEGAEKAGGEETEVGTGSGTAGTEEVESSGWRRGNIGGTTEGE